MSFSLYAATVPSCLQMLGALSGLLERAADHCAQAGTPPEAILRAQLAEDMHPFAYQVKSATVHSLGAIEGVRAGLFRPDRSEPPATFDALGQRMRETIAALQAVSPDELEGFIGRDVRFEIGDRHIDFLAEDFLLSFSQPNFYFHVTTAYDILRANGVPIGKRDYLGRLRKK
ncbi:MAG TPA: DUF1993 domain-containing protein [Sphingobium sp.]